MFSTIAIRPGVDDDNSDITFYLDEEKLAVQMVCKAQEQQ
jgi:hypothetical protein